MGGNWIESRDDSWKVFSSTNTWNLKSELYWKRTNRRQQAVQKTNKVWAKTNRRIKIRRRKMKLASSGTTLEQCRVRLYFFCRNTANFHTAHPLYTSVNVYASRASSQDTLALHWSLLTEVCLSRLIAIKKLLSNTAGDNQPASVHLLAPQLGLADEEPQWN